MIFLTKEDYYRKISQEILNQITGGVDELLNTAETSAAGIIRDMLSGMYNIDAELNKSGTNRHNNLLLWMLNLSAYLIYDRIPDDEVPERIVKDYDDTMTTLRKIASGKESTTMTPVMVDGVAKKVFRMGGNDKRSHSML